MGKNGNVLPLVFAKFSRINSMKRGDNTSSQTIRMQIKEKIRAADLQQIKIFCLENLNPEAEISFRKSGKTYLMSISMFRGNEISNLIKLIKK